MKQEEQKQQQACGLYVAPLLEVVHLQVERGFAASGGAMPVLTTLELYENDANNGQFETYTIQDGWGTTGNTFWD